MTVLTQRPNGDIKPQSKDSGLYIPPNGLSFGLIGKTADKAAASKDQLFALFQQHSLNESGKFTLQNTVASLFPFSRALSHSQDSQYWKFEFEPVDVVGVHWETTAAEVVPLTPKCGADVVVKNSLNRDQTFSWSYQEDLAALGVATRLDGFPLSQSVTINSGLPTLSGNMKVIVDERSKVSWQLCTLVRHAVSYPDTYKFTVGPHATAHAYAMTTRAHVEIPFVVQLKGKTSGVETSMRGIWRGKVAGHYSAFALHNHCPL